MNKEAKSANYPKLDINKFVADYKNKFKFNGFIDEGICYIEEFSLKDRQLWKRFVEQFELHPDSEGSNRLWRGEYWGKMMRGACFTYSYTQDKELFDILTETVEDMLKTQESDGRLSTYKKECEFDGWDLWCRKYVLLGLQYYLEIAADNELIDKIVACISRQLDYIIKYIGEESDGKKPITEATRNWRGVNSVSILEPVVRAYNITKNKDYLDFADYIVSTGGTSVENIFELAYKNELYPYQYPVTKAYEVTSCFEGLLEYYKVTRDEKYKIAVINFADKILESDFTVIGGGGCTLELFDHSTVRQANTNKYENDKIKQETCVTVTLMKFFYELNMLTGNSKYADAFETSMYNAFWGAINTNKALDNDALEKYPSSVMEPLPFDSYSPLTAGTRGNGIGGLLLMSDNHYYGCCACIGGAGTGLIPKMAVMSTGKGIALNLYIDGEIKTYTPQGKEVKVFVETDYPVSGAVKIKLDTQSEEEIELLLRNPAWSGKTEILINNKPIESTDGYISISRVWKDTDEVVLKLDMRTEAVKPIPYGGQVLMNKVIWGKNYIVPCFDKEDEMAHRHISLRRGPLVLAADNRLGYSVDEPFDIEIEDSCYVNTRLPKDKQNIYKNILEMEVPQKDGSYFTVTDYASAGKTWNKKSKMAAWLLLK